LPSVPQPDQSSEVVEVFTGDTLEQAMAYAVAALGPDLSVRRARKVRKGVQGLVGKDRYEVVAIPSPSPASDDAVQSAFDALLEQAEAAEEPSPRVRRTTRPASPHPAPSVAEHTAPARPAPRAPVTRAPRPAPVVEEVPTLTRAVARPAVAPPPPPPPPPARKPRKGTAVVKAPTKAPARTKASRAPVPAGWSRQALVDLGLPTTVLRALPAEDPVDDLAWVVALAVAMSAVLPAPAALDAAHPLVVNGYGTEGVLWLLDAAARGLTPGTITVGDRTAAATATELALAVRTAVVG
jgi:hypothetical protein